MTEHYPQGDDLSPVLRRDGLVSWLAYHLHWAARSAGPVQGEHGRVPLLTLDWYTSQPRNGHYVVRLTSMGDYAVPSGECERQHLDVLPVCRHRALAEALPDCKGWGGHAGRGPASRMDCAGCRTDRVAVLQAVARAARVVVPGRHDWRSWPMVCPTCERLQLVDWADLTPAHHTDRQVPGRHQTDRRCRTTSGWQCSVCQPVVRPHPAAGGLVYLMRSGVGSGLVHKIGYSVDPEARRAQLGTATPHGVQLVLAVSGQGAPGVPNLEKYMHDWATGVGQRLNGEWWQLPPDGPEAMAAEAERLGYAVHWWVQA